MLCKKRIPSIIDNAERILRLLFHPKYVTKDEKIRPNAFRPSAKDEVSVNRLDYSSPFKCKAQGLYMQRKKYVFFGFGVLKASEIRNVNADVIYHPTENKAHANIKVGYIPEKGQEFPAEFQYKYKQLSKIARLYKDPHPDKKTWDGDELT